MREIRFGVIGTGKITGQMIEGARLHSGIRLTAVCSRTKERARAFAEDMQEPYVLLFDSLEEMAKSDGVDLIYIASPNACHMEQAELCLRHGKHVLCEKPLSADPERLMRVQALAREKGLLFREAIMMLYQPQREILRRAVESCGQISSAHFDFCQLSSKYEEYLMGETPNIFNPALHTGAMMDLGVYCVYPAIDLFGIPESITASATFLRTGADGAGAAMLKYPDKTVTLTYSKTGQAFYPSAIVGDKGTVTIRNAVRLEDIRLYRVGEPETVLCEPEPKIVLMGREIAAAADDICKGNVLDSEKDRLALEVSRCMAAIRRSAGIRFPGLDEE